MSRPIVVVTGIGGFISRHLAAQALQQGYDVRGTVRDPARTGDIEAAIRSAAGPDGNLSFFRADLLKDAGWDEVMQGADFLLHAASPFPPTVPKDENELIRPAREGALRALTAAHKAGIKRVVLTSSIAATNYGKGHAPFTEADWTDPDGPLASPYYKSKTLAEKAAWAYAAETGLALSVVNPALVFGPILGRETGTSVGLIRDMLSGSLPALPDYGMAIVDVRDVADLHLRAMTDPAAVGERFIAGADAPKMGEIARILKTHFPAYARKIPGTIMPHWMTRLAALFIPGARLVIPELGRDGRVSHDKATRLLGWTPRPAKDAIIASAQSLIDAGLV